LRAEAEEKIRKDEKVEIAKNLILLGSDNNFIEKATGLTVEQIEQLRNEIKKN
jgi:ribosomal protein L10